MHKELESTPISAVSMPVSLKGVLRDINLTLADAIAGFKPHCRSVKSNQLDTHTPYAIVLAPQPTSSSYMVFAPHPAAAPGLAPVWRE